MAKYTPRRAKVDDKKPLFSGLFPKASGASARRAADPDATIRMKPITQEAPVEEPVSSPAEQTEEVAMAAEVAAAVSQVMDEEPAEVPAAPEAEPAVHEPAADVPAEEPAEPEAEAAASEEDDFMAAVAASIPGNTPESEQPAEEIPTEEAATDPMAEETVIVPGFHMAPKDEPKPEAAAPETGDEVTPPEPPKSSGKKKCLIAAAIAAVLAAAYVGACAWVDPTAALPKTTVNGSDVSGMDAPAICKIVEDDFQKNYAGKTINVNANGESYSVAMGSSLMLDSDAVAQEALTPSNGSFLSRGWYLLRNAVAGNDVIVYPTVGDQEALSTALTDSGLMDIDTTTQTTYELKDDALVFTMGKVGVSVDQAQLTEQLNAAVAADDYTTAVECPMVEGTVEPVDVEAVYKEHHTEMVNATLDPKHDYEIVPSVEGVDFDKAEAEKILAAAAEGSEVSVPVKRTKPVVSTKSLKKNLFKDVLGTYTTHVSGTTNRLKNVQQAAANINGTIMLNGDEFSYNGTVGERTAANGFYTAGAYLNGQTVQEFGGGVCQVSSTAYIAIVRANLEIVERHNHTYVSSYVPLGMDATVSWGGPDFRFKNNRDYPIKIVTNYNAYYQQLTVTIMGTNVDGSSADLVSKQLAWTDYATIYKDDPDMFEGETRKAVDGEPAAKAQTYRVVYDKNGKEISRTEESYSVYTRRDQIVYRGTKKKEPEKPEETEEEKKKDDKKPSTDKPTKPDNTKPAKTN